MTTAPTHAALVDSLWRARRNDGSVSAEPLSADEGFAVLRQLVTRAVDDGDDVVGWKIARVPGDDGAPFFFAAPVFRTSFDAGSRLGLASPKLEVELVGRVTAVGAEMADWASDWQLGIEIVANHDPSWPLAPGWAIADWGLHAAAVVGDECDGPSDDQTYRVCVETGGAPVEAEGVWRTGHATVTAVLARDCVRAARPCQPGDLVWSGALLPPASLDAGVGVRASVEGLGSVAFDPS